MAASRSTSSGSTPSVSSLAPRRISFARIAEPLEVPDLLALQTASFKWLIGDDEWRAANEPGALCGLEEILTEISPIRDFSDTMSLEFREPRLMEPPHSVEECKDKDMTYSAPLFVIAEFTNNETGEIKSQTVFMGDFPL
ncbi:MAG: DNA-directed polymerase subunit beta, partial [Frankiaceae bacterium]|nr:DNA-directed polymerase subunit beta [Frankiaceae bacterium]